MKVSGTNLGITMIFLGIYLWSTRKQDKSSRIIGATCFLVVGCFLDSLCGLVIEGILEGDSWGQMGFVALAFSKGMMAAALPIVCMICGKYPADRREDGSGDSMGGDRTQGHPHMTYMGKLMVAGSAFMWCVLLVSGAALGRTIGTRRDASPRQDGILEADFAWTCVLFVVLLAFYLSMYWHDSRERGRQDARDRRQERRHTEFYLYTVESNYQRTRELWHDLRNHISLLYLLLQEEKYDQMRDYLKVFGEEVDRIALPAKSGNLIVDAVLADKAARAKRENIEVKVELCDLTGLCLKPDEICSLFGNLLDNAMEACQKVDGEKKITVTCRVWREETYLSVRNTMEEKTSGQDNLLVSHKKDRENVVGHGLGLRSVERVVNRYGGEMVTDAEGGIFTVAVRLPGEKK